MSGFSTILFPRSQLGDCGSVHSLTAAYGFKQPPAATAEKWWQRKALPNARLPLLLGVLEPGRSGPVSVLPYIDR